MAERRVYTDEDRAKAAVMLQANDGNVTRTARDLGLPKQTIKSWKVKWDKEGYPEGLKEAIPAAAEGILLRLTQLQTLALNETIKALEEGQVRGKDAAWILGVVTDKIRLIQGQSTSRSETVQLSVPDPKELARALAQFVSDTHSAAEQRDAEIKEVVVEQGEFKPLPG